MKQVEIIDDIYEAALKIATERHESVQSVVEQILREKMLHRPNASAIIGAFSDEPDAVDLMMEYAMELRERPLRIANG